jgi:hypothetical protein
MVRRCSSVVALPILFALCTAVVARAQESSGGAPAHVSFVDGSVTLEREGRIDDAPSNIPLLAGDRLRTRNGRVEILFGDGSTLHLDQDTTLDLQSDELVRLIAGRVRLSIPGPSREIAYRVDTASGWAQIADAGEYRAAFVQDELELAVLRGRAEVINEAGRTPLRAGERAFVRASGAPSYAYVFNSAAMDTFDRWSEARRSERLGLSTQYLPEEVRPYSASFDRNGSWRYESSYGYVWYPRVAVGWRPYYHGRWVTVAPYGPTWVSVDPWGWPTHHYGRWGFSGGSWFWIPGRTWGAAWVSWGYAPGYVSWCPLGWNNRPVVSFVNVNVYRGYNPWHAWTVVPYNRFGHGYVHHTVVAGNHLDARTRGAFKYGDRPPSATGYAVPRGSAAPIRVAGTGPSRGTATPLLTNRGAENVQPSRSVAAGSADRGFARSDSPLRAGSRPSGVTPQAATERALPDRPMVRSERGVPSDARMQAAARPEAGGRPSARAVERPSYQPSERTAIPRRSAYDAPSSAGALVSTPRSLGSTRSAEAPTYRREDGYRAQPNTYTPSERRAVPRGEYGRPAASEPRTAESNRSGAAAPRYAPSPSYGAPQRSAPGASAPRSADAPPAPGSRPSGAGGPSRGTARPRGGGN